MLMLNVTLNIRKSMKKRSLFAVFILPFVTFGIYGIVWLVKTKDEMNRQGAKIPTAWLLIVPFVSYYWLYKYAEGVERITSAKMSTIVVFLLQLFLGVIGNTILQSEFNKITDTAQPMVTETAMPVSAQFSDGTTINADTTPMQPNVVSMDSSAPITTPQPTVFAPVNPPAPLNNQYQSNAQVPTSDTVVNQQSNPSALSTDDNQKPSAPSQF